MADEQLRRLSSGFFDSALAFFQLNAGLDCARHDQVGMSKGVISDDVAGFEEIAHDVRPALHIAPNQEKSSVHTIFLQNFHQAQGMRIVGPIVIGERNLLADGRGAHERRTEALGPWRHRLVGSDTCGGHGNSGANERTKHGAAIVNPRRTSVRVDSALENFEPTMGCANEQQPTAETQPPAC